jgi:opacity protein-like surface antigen
MRKILFIAVLALAAIAMTAVTYADQAAPTATTTTTTTVTTQKAAPATFEKKFKIEGYAEYINFMGGDIDNSTWGGGVLARYLFTDWFGAQTNISFYGDCNTNDLPENLSLANWRLSLLVHTYAPDIDNKLYGYAGGGLGVQFNDDMGIVKIDNALTGHVLLGIGYDVTETINIEAEVGYQFGKADVENYTESDIGLEALFVRLGAGIRF